MTALRAWWDHHPFPTRDTPHDKVKPSECAVYRFYDRGGALLYVGIAWNPGRRWERHKRESPWFRNARRVRVDVYATEREALTVERLAIRDEKPLYNKRSAIR